MIDHPPLRRRIRSERERGEAADLAPAAARSVGAGDRVRPEEPDPYRTAFARDRDRILHSLAFRRLKHKTQVFLNPSGDHFTTRLTHVLQVTQVARALASGLGLNETLAEAIALGHDVGHTPFGHTGEDALEPYFADGWHHAAQGVRIFDVLEDCNLTAQVRDGIRAHTWKIQPPPATQEGYCVRYADRIAYLSHDALDALRAGLIATSDFPSSTRAHFGEPGTEWIGRMVEAVIEHSAEAGHVALEPDALEAMHELRRFMFAAIYQSGENERRREGAIAVIRHLMDHYLAHPDLLPASYRDNDADLVTQAADYVSGMTDRYALTAHDRLFRPRLFDPSPVLGDPT